MIRVLVCDDQAVVTDGLELILNADPEIQVVGTAHDGAEALLVIPQAQAGPGIDGLEDAGYERHPGYARDQPEIS